MRKLDLDYLRFKQDTLHRYNGMYQTSLRDSVVSNEGVNDRSIKKAIDIYTERYHINGGGFICDANPANINTEIRLDTVCRCVNLLWHLYYKTPATKSRRYVSSSPACTVSSYGLKHILEDWLTRLSGNTVSKPFESASSSYVSNGEAILACLVLRDQAEEWPSHLVWFTNKSLTDVHITPNLYNIRFNKCYKNFLRREMDFFTEKHFEFGYDIDGKPVAFAKFDERRFNDPFFIPFIYPWGATETDGKLF